MRIPVYIALFHQIKNLILTNKLPTIWRLCKSDLQKLASILPVAQVNLIFNKKRYILLGHELFNYTKRRNGNLCLNIVHQRHQTGKCPGPIFFIN